MERILYIDKTKLKKAPHLQKDIDLEDLIDNCCKYYSSEEEALKDNYVPLEIGFSVRTTYTNKVLEMELQNGVKRYYSTLVNIPVLPFTGIELLMYMTSVGIVRCTKGYYEEFSEVMVHSIFQPIGLLNIDPDVTRPIIYLHVILKDDTEERFINHLKEGNKLVDIKDIDTEGNLQVLCDELIIIEEED